jgi:hypothetical protein
MGWRRHVTVLVIHHPNKNPDGSALYKIGGTLGWAAAARVVHFIVPDPDRPGRCLLTSVGSNLGARHPGYAYQITPERIVNGTITTSRVVWEDEPINMTADQALEAFRSAKSKTEVAKAIDWLKDLLGKGPMRVEDIKQVALKAGKPRWGSIIRAYSQMDIIKSKEPGLHGKHLWDLPLAN